MKRILAVAFGILAATTLLLASAASPAIAATPKISPEVSLKVHSYSGNSDALTLVGQSTSNAKGREIAFFVETREFTVSRWMFLGSSSTNSKGAAVFYYTPTWTGTSIFGVGLRSKSTVAPSSTTSFKVQQDPTAVPTSAMNYSRPLKSVGGWLVRALLSMVVIIWLLLLGSLVLVVRRMPRLARREVTKEGVS